MAITTQDGHEEGLEAAQRSTTPPHSPRSFPSPSLATLPTEILTVILRAIPHHSPFERNLSLTQICRVSKLFLNLARPLLYYEVHLDPNLHSNRSTSSYSKLITTLLFSSQCSECVRSIRLTIAEDGGDIDWILLRSVLRQCAMLEKLSTEWDTCEGTESDVQSLCEVITKEATSIKHLEIPNIKLFLPPALLLVQALHQLESLVFRPIGLHRKIRSKFNLRRVAWINKMPHRALRFYLCSSSHSLTNLSLTTDYNDPPKLDNFPNLSTLRLVLGDFFAVRSDHALQSRLEEACIDAVRLILLSTHSLRIKHLVISTKLLETAQTLADFSLVDSLPPSIVTLAVVPQLLGIVNLPALLPVDQVKPYPALRRLTSIPPLFTDAVTVEIHENMTTNLRQVSKVFQHRQPN